MRLSWNEIRIRAAAFAREWAGQGYEKGQTQLFYRDFFEVFGMPVRRVAAFIAAAFAIEPFAAFLARFKRHMHRVEQAMGVLLILTGIAFLTGTLTSVSFWLLETFPVFSTID